MTTCVELSGVVAAATVASSSIALCGTANILQKLRGTRDPKPRLKQIRRSRRSSTVVGPKLKAYPDHVECFIDGRKEGGHVGFDGEVFLHSPKGNDWIPTMVVSGAEITQDGETLIIEQHLPQKVMLKFGSIRQANAWRLQLSVCKELPDPTVRITELRNYYKQQEKVIEALRGRVGHLKEDNEHLEVVKEKYEKVEKEKAEKEAPKKKESARSHSSGQLAEMGEVKCHALEELQEDLGESLFEQQQIPAKTRGLEETHVVLHEPLLVKQDMDDLKAKVIEREKQRDDAQTQVYNLTRDLGNVRSSYRELEQQMSEQSRSIEAVQAEKHAFEQKARDLELALAAAGHSQTMLETKAANIEKAKATIAQLEMLLTAEKRKTSEMEGTIKSKDAQVADMKQALKTKDQMLARMKGEFDDLHQAQRTFADQNHRVLAQLQADRDYLDQENASLRSAYDELKAAYENILHGPATSSPSVSETRDLRIDELHISKVKEKSNDLKDQVEQTWKKINEQTRLIDHERAAFWNELELVRKKVSSRSSGVSPGASASKASAYSNGYPSRSTPDLQQSSTESSPYKLGMGKLGGVSSSRHTLPSRLSGGQMKAPDGAANRLAMPSSCGAAARPAATTFARTAAVGGRDISGEMGRATPGMRQQQIAKFDNLLHFASDCEVNSNPPIV